MAFVSRFPVLQASLASADGGQAVQIAVVDGVLQRSHNLLFSPEELRPCEIDAGDGVVRNEGAVTVQVLHEDFQLFQHFLFSQRLKLPALRLLQQRRAGEERQAARTHDGGMALAEDLGRVQGVLSAVLPPGHAVEEATFLQREQTARTLPFPPTSACFSAA